MSWQATFYQRVYELGPDTYAPALAGILPIGGIIGGVGGGLVGDWLSRRGGLQILTAGKSLPPVLQGRKVTACHRNKHIVARILTTISWLLYYLKREKSRNLGHQDTIFPNLIYPCSTLYEIFFGLKIGLQLSSSEGIRNLNILQKTSLNNIPHRW